MPCQPQKTASNLHQIFKNEENMDKNLFNTRLVDLTGAELVSLIQEAAHEASCNNVYEHQSSASGPKALLRGYKELSAFLKCSVPTACRIVTRGDITSPAIIRSGKTLLFVPDLVLQQLSEVDSRWQVHKNDKRKLSSIK